jgi:hypothetical protein
MPACERISIMSRPRRRFRRIAKWIGTAVSVFTAVVYILCIPTVGSRSACVILSMDSGLWMFGAGEVVFSSNSATPREIRTEFWGPKPLDWGYTVQADKGRFAYGIRMPNWNGLKWIRMPLWLPFIVFAAPTTYLWHRDRRRIPPGHCHSCNYNLTGNTSGICPECGTPCLTPADSG